MRTSVRYAEGSPQSRKGREENAKKIHHRDTEYTERVES
jgi:hypothetical protein